MGHEFGICVSLEESIESSTGDCVSCMKSQHVPSFLGSIIFELLKGSDKSGKPSKVGSDVGGVSVVGANGRWDVFSKNIDISCTPFGEMTVVIIDCFGMNESKTKIVRIQMLINRGQQNTRERQNRSTYREAG